MYKDLFVIREYKQEDSSQVEQCIIELQDFERTLEPDCVEGITIAKRYLQEILDECQAKEGKIFVAASQEQIVGFVSIRREQNWDNYLSSITDHAYISDLVVLPAYRRQGIGKLLMQKSEAYARQLEIKIVKIGVLSRNQPAIQLYEQSGFRNYELVLMKELESDSK